MRKFQVVEIVSEFGAGTRGSSLGVDAIRVASVEKGYRTLVELPTERVEPDLNILLNPQQYPNAKRITTILEVYESISDKVGTALMNESFPVVLSGDHSNAAGTIAGIKKAYPNKRLGVIWIDAHGDLHTPFSSPSGNLHGMPVAAALGLDNRHIGKNKPSLEVEQTWQDIQNLGGINPKINPEDLVFLGIRDLEEEEWAIVKEKKIKYFTVQEVDEIGTRNAIESILSYLVNCDLIYISLDIDSLDAAFVPGTGTPVSKGFSYTQVEALVKGFWGSNKLVCLEITEVNPLLGMGNRTAEIAADILEVLLKS